MVLLGNKRATTTSKITGKRSQFSMFYLVNETVDEYRLHWLGKIFGLYKDLCIYITWKMFNEMWRIFLKLFLIARKLFNRLPLLNTSDGYSLYIFNEWSGNRIGVTNKLIDFQRLVHKWVNSTLNILYYIYDIVFHIFWQSRKKNSKI